MVGYSGAVLLISCIELLFQHIILTLSETGIWTHKTVILSPFLGGYSTMSLFDFSFNIFLDAIIVKYFKGKGVKKW